MMSSCLCMLLRRLMQRAEGKLQVQFCLWLVACSRAMHLCLEGHRLVSWCPVTACFGHMKDVASPRSRISFVDHLADHMSLENTIRNENFHSKCCLAASLHDRVS